MTLSTWLTISRPILTLPGVWFLREGSAAHNWIALAILLLAASTDFLDGYLARRRGEVTNLGRYLDPVADKVAVVTVLVYLTFVRENLPVWFTLVMIGKDAAILLGGFYIIRACSQVVQADPPGKGTVTVVAAAIACYVVDASILGHVVLLVALGFVLHSTYFYYVKFLNAVGRRHSLVRRAAGAAGGLAAVVAVVIATDSGYAHTANVPRTSPPLVIAYRGASASAPENTLAAVDSAIAAQADLIEIDLRLSADSVLVAMHDADVTRTTDGSGPVSDQDLAQLRTLSAGAWYGPAFAGERIPTLDEVLERTASSRLLLDMKTTSALALDRLLDRVAAHAAADRIVVQALDAAFLEQLRRREPRLVTQRLVVGRISGLPLWIGDGVYLGEPHGGGAAGVSIHRLAANPASVRHCRDAGLRVFVWTVTDPGDMARFIAAGVDAILTDRPRVLRALLAEGES